MKKLDREILASIFNNYYPLSNSSLDNMLNSCEIKQIKKGDRFSSINKLDLNEYFILVLKYHLVDRIQRAITTEGVFQ